MHMSCTLSTWLALSLGVGLTTPRVVAQAFDVVVEASGSSQGIKLASAMTRPMGSIVLKSTCSPVSDASMPAWSDIANDVVVNEKRLQGSRYSRPVLCIHLHVVFLCGGVDRPADHQSLLVMPRRKPIVAFRVEQWCEQRALMHASLMRSSLCMTCRASASDQWPSCVNVMQNCWHLIEYLHTWQAKHYFTLQVWAICASPRSAEGC